MPEELYLYIIAFVVGLLILFFKWLVAGKNLNNIIYLNYLDSKPKLVLGATLIYAVVGGLACWGPPALIIFLFELPYDIHRMSLEQLLMLFAVGASVAILVGLPLTYFGGRRWIFIGVFLISGFLLMISCMLTLVAAQGM